jgi:amylosucrase
MLPEHLMKFADLAIKSVPLGLPIDRQAEFQRRFALHGARLHATLQAVYGASSGFDAWFSTVCAGLAVQVAQRPDDLYAIDLARIRQPAWFTAENALAYSSYTDKFAGTLEGVEKRIPYLKSLGVSYLHLLPFLRARAHDNDGGFAVSSFEEVEPALGNLQSLRSLTRALRGAGISLCTDFVLNHVADDHDWALAARRGDAKYRNYFHIFNHLEETDGFTSKLGQVFPETAPGNFTRVDDLQAWVWTTFYPYQWDLNYGNPTVFFEMAQALLKLSNHGIEIFRLDSAAFLWKREGTNCMNQPECHLILQALRAIVDIAAPGVLLKAEAIVPVHELPPYFGIGPARGEECHLAYNSSLMTACWLSLAEQDADMVYRVMRATPAMPANCSWLNYVRCHDDIGWNVLRPELHSEFDGGHARLIYAAGFFSGQTPGSYAAGASFQTPADNQVHGTNGMAASLVGLSTAVDALQVQQALARLTLMYGIAMSAGGTPLIYMGDELGLGNDQRPVSLWPPGSDGRQLHRPDFPGLAEDAGNGTGNRVLAAFRHLVAMRFSLPDLAADTTTVLLDTLSTRVLAYRRGRHLQVAANFTENPLPLSESVPGIFEKNSCLIDCISGQRVGPGYVLAPWQLVWLNPTDPTGLESPNQQNGSP